MQTPQNYKPAASWTIIAEENKKHTLDDTVFSTPQVKNKVLNSISLKLLPYFVFALIFLGLVFYGNTFKNLSADLFTPKENQPVIFGMPVNKGLPVTKTVQGEYVEKEVLKASNSGSVIQETAEDIQVEPLFNPVETWVNSQIAENVFIEPKVEPSFVQPIKTNTNTFSVNQNISGVFRVNTHTVNQTPVVSHDIQPQVNLNKTNPQPQSMTQTWPAETGLIIGSLFFSSSAWIVLYYLRKKMK